MLWWMLQASVVVAAMTVVVAVLCRIGRLRPAVQHALWLVVLLKLATPNVVTWPWSVEELLEQVWGGEAPVAGVANELNREAGSARFSRSRSTARAQVSPMHTTGRPAVNDVAGSGDPAATALPRELTDEERQLVESVLVQGAEPGNSGGALQEFADVDQVSNAASAGLRPPLAGESRNWPAILWLCGAAAYAAQQVSQIVRFRRMLRGAHSPPAWLEQSVRELSACLAIRPPRTLLAMGVSSPCLWCCGRPLLLWPDRLADERLAERWRGVIVHELAHLRRRDHWVAWLELVVGCAWWWNPLYWLVRRRLRETADLACDAWAVWTLPDAQREYAESLLEVTRNTSRMPAATPVLGATGGARRSYQRRIAMIMSPRVPCRVPKFGLLCAGLLAAVSVPAWSLDDRAPPTTDNNEVPSASIDTGSDAALTPASQDAAAIDTSGDPTTATTGAAVDPDPTSGSELPASARSNAPTGLALSDPMGKSTDADRIERLEQQLEALLTEIRSLRGGRGEYGRSMAMPAWRTAANRANSAPAFSPDGKLIAVVTEDGRIAVLEAGTGKEVRRIDLGAAASTQVLMFNPQGTILYACADDGSYVQYDVASGKQLSRSVAQRPVPNYGDDRSSVNQPVPGGTTAAPPAASPGAPLNDFTPTAHASTAANPFAAADAGASSSGGLAQSLAGAQIDLIRLATEYTEAAGEKKLAERQLSRIHGLERANAISEEQVVTAEVQFETAANKLALLRAIAEAAAEATKGELEFAERMADKGYASPANVTQLKAKLRIISLILDGGTGSSQ